jgi:hypothetical protein
MMTASELRAALEPIETQLRRLADLFESLTRAEPETPPTPACPHPEELRLTLGPGGTAWKCEACGHLELTTPLTAD